MSICESTWIQAAEKELLKKEDRKQQRKERRKAKGSGESLDYCIPQLLYHYYIHCREAKKCYLSECELI